MESTKNHLDQDEKRGRGPKYCVNIEGTEHDWPRDTITTEEIAELGGWDPAKGVQLIDRDQNERTLAPGEVVELTPGHSFCKKVRFVRGLVTGERRAAEAAALKGVYPAIEHRDDWFRIPEYPVPVGWSPRPLEVAFMLNAGHPATPPYGIYVSSATRINGAVPTNYAQAEKHRPPFDGTWGVLSWKPERWRGAVEDVIGWSLLDWVRSFDTRFAELN